MRTTITLDSDVESLLRRVMRERRLTFKAAVNEAIRRGLTQDTSMEAVETPTYDMGRPRIDLTQALSLAGDLEDEELLHKTRLGK